MADVEKRKVAVVDDDDAARDSLRFLLEVAGHAVETFASAAELLRAEFENLRCLILDYHMPVMNGLELAGRLRAHGSAIPILLVTGLPSPAIVARAAELGIDRVLAKPFDEDDLLNFVDAHRS